MTYPALSQGGVDQVDQRVDQVKGPYIVDFERNFLSDLPDRPKNRGRVYFRLRGLEKKIKQKNPPVDQKLYTSSRKKVDQVDQAAKDEDEPGE